MAYDLMRGRQDGNDWSLGASITTSRDDVEEKLRVLTVGVDSLNADVTAWYRKHQDDVDAKKFVRAWVEWRDATYGFIKSWGKAVFKFRWNFYSYVDEADQKLRDLSEWRKRWEELSGERSTAPATVAPPVAKPSEGGGAWKWLAILGAGGIGALLLSRKIGG